MTALYGVRVASRIRREFQTDVDTIHGQYGEFKVLVDDDVVIDGGSAAFLGVLPSTKKILSAIQAKLSACAEARS